MNFSQALDFLKQGKRMARNGWNGKGLWVKLIDVGPSLIVDGVAKSGGRLHTYINPFFIIGGNSSGGVNTWVPSVSDCLAEDWEEAH